MKKVVKATALVTLIALNSLSAEGLSMSNIGINLGKSYSNYKQEDKAGTVLLSNSPDKSFNVVELSTEMNGLFSNDDIKPYISYTYSNNDDFKQQYLLIGINKYFELTSELKPYIGVLGGYGELEWRYDPLNDAKDIEKDAYSFIGGFDLGTEYVITENIVFNLNAKLLFHGYKTDLVPSSLSSSTANATIKHDMTSVLSAGLKYRF